MQPRRLTVIQSDDTPTVVKGTTCFATQKRYNVSCKRQDCQHWFSNEEGLNCVIITAQNGPHTLQKIGQIYNLTRMRICQIEKNIFEKIRKIS